MTTDGRTLIRQLKIRSRLERQSGLGIRDQTYPSIFEDTAFIRLLKGVDIRTNAPELRFTELDQADPAGRYRLRVYGDVVVL